jgi:nucleotide sugar dehydrogenase
MLSSKKHKPRIGFIGQGFVGKNYADDFARRGFKVIRYDIDAYQKNQPLLFGCQVIFVAVPTPTTPKGFQDKTVIEAIRRNTKDGQIVVIKSTIVPGTTEKIQKLFPKRYLIHSPEFLVEKTAANDTAHPLRNIVGYTQKSKKVAKFILSLMPRSGYDCLLPSNEAELIKYMSNVLLTNKVLIANLFYDFALTQKINYDRVAQAIAVDPRIGPSHLRILHSSHPKNKRLGRGAGGHCFIKDLAAFRQVYQAFKPLNKSQKLIKKTGLQMILALENYNKILLKSTKKDLDLLKKVYGKKL